MRRSTKVAVAGLIVVAAFFFLAPVAFWYNLGSPIAGRTMSVSIYRSLGCVTLGVGDLLVYSPSGFGFMFGCEIPGPLPL
jgi:hypothetical protein